MGDRDQENVIIELTQGRELARQLHIHLNMPSSSHETRELLVLRILTSYDKALSMLKWSGTAVGEPSTIGVLAGISDSPRFLSASPRSKDADRDSKDAENKDADRDSRDPENKDADRDSRNPENKDVSRKRKSLPKWRTQAKICTELTERSLEEPLDDGYSWRKYGQKEILGSKFPRGYYRCTHRRVQGCLATKQVQRSVDDPTVFELTYRGRHTCIQASQINIPSTQNPEPNQSHDHHQQNQIQQEKLFDFRTAGLRVMLEDFYTNETAFPSFSFRSTSVNKPDNFDDLPSMVHNNHPAGPQNLSLFPSMLDNHLPREIPSVSMMSSSVGSLSV